MIAIEEGQERRWAKGPRDAVAARVEHVHALAAPPAPRAAVEVAPKLAAGASERRLLTAKEAAKHLSIGARLLWSMSAPRGPLPVVRLGSLVRYPSRTWMRLFSGCSSSRERTGRSKLPRYGNATSLADRMR